ncbi:hypothetical protein quinque_005839 [Culex quinquefasciatus]
MSGLCSGYIQNGRKSRGGLSRPETASSCHLMSMLMLLLLGAIPSSAQQQQYSAGCDFYQDVASGRSYAIYSPNYGGPYPVNIRCRWTLATTPGSRIALSCPDVAIPQSASCSYDKLLISTGGQANLGDARAYCGTGTLTTESTGSSMVVALDVPASSADGGRFYCTATKLDCACGMRRKKRIVGGTETLVNEFPMLAALVDSTGGGIFCGATITSIRSHESYSTVTKQNDIAIVRTQTEILFTAGVGPACLPFKFFGASFVGVELEAVGWGSTDFGYPKSNVPMKVDLPVVDPGRCNGSYSYFTSSQLCTWNDGKDTCQSDSGGPLFYTDFYNGLVYLTGIVSYGRACATNDPSVSTRVTDFMSWVIQNTPEWTYCYQ